MGEWVPRLNSIVKIERFKAGEDRPDPLEALAKAAGRHLRRARRKKKAPAK